MKLWGGRFEQGPSEVFERFSGSLHFDRRLFTALFAACFSFGRGLMSPFLASASRLCGSLALGG